MLSYADFASALTALGEANALASAELERVELLDSPLMRLVPQRPQEPARPHPGAHHRWLAGHVRSARPRRILELGTGDGVALVSMCVAAGIASSDTPTRVATVDRSCVLEREHFIPEEIVEDPRVAIVTGDAESAQPYRGLGFKLAECDLVSIDALHDGAHENRVLEALRDGGLRDGTPVLVGGIRSGHGMRAWWSHLRMPRIELPLDGSGIGLLSFQQGLWEPLDPGVLAAHGVDWPAVAARVRSQASRALTSTRGYQLLRRVVRRAYGV